MKKNNEQTIGEAIKYFIQEHGMQERVLESMAIDAWHQQMGDFMKKYTDALYVKKRILFVKLNSPAFKNELSYGKSKIIEHINSTLKEQFIQDIRFL
ncbi:DUF721 domain-containing protein [Weeksellaceae bacterium TAE3-ERU29]|nr:DUF721 domain-containing protein [Weeksellaceae bacterium TAE3-ERU29]